MKQLVHIEPWEEHALDNSFAEALMEEVNVLRRRNGEHGDDDPWSGGMAVSSTEEVIQDPAFFMDPNGIQPLYYINIVAGAKARNTGRISFVDFNYQGSGELLLIPYQFTGVVTAPVDQAHPNFGNSFFGRLFQTFVQFLMLPVTALINTWDALRRYVLQSGDPANMGMVYKSHGELQQKKDHINPRENPLIPVDFIPIGRANNYQDVSPQQAGLGVFVTRKNGYTYQLVDEQRSISPYLNERQSVAGWAMPADVGTVIIKWMSAKAGYERNDGECFGSFLLCEKK